MMTNTTPMWKYSVSSDGGQQSIEVAGGGGVANGSTQNAPPPPSPGRPATLDSPHEFNHDVGPLRPVRPLHKVIDDEVHGRFRDRPSRQCLQERQVIW